MDNFRDELTSLINCHSLENASDTPDFILANYLMACLNAFDVANSARQEMLLLGRETTKQQIIERG